MRPSVDKLEVNTKDDGILSFLELRFPVVRFYWLRGPSAARGAHAHKDLRQIMICMAGNVEIEFLDGKASSVISLGANDALQVEPGLWRNIRPLGEGDILLVGASAAFDEEDYIREYEDFLRWRNV